MPARRSLPIFVLAIVAGCANPNARYAKLVPLPFDGKYSKVIVDLNAQKADVVSSGKTALDLSPQAQAILLQDMLRQRKSGQTDTEIAQSLLGIKAKEATKDLSRFPMQIILTTRYSKVHYPDERADRLEFLSVSITPHDAEFEKLDKLDTQYGTINLGTVARESDFAVSAELDPSIAGVGAKLTPSFTRKNTDAHNLNSRFVQLSGELSPGHVSLFEQGAEGQDLVGNTVFQLNIHETDTSVWTVFGAPALEADGVLISPSNIRLTQQDVVTATRPVTADVNYRYYIRHIVSGARTTGEYDDHVQYVHGICKELVNLDSPTIASLSTNGTTTGRISVTPVPRAGVMKTQLLLFSSSPEAHRFALWLSRERNSSLANYQLVDTDGRLLSASKLANLTVVPVNPLLTDPVATVDNSAMSQSEGSAPSKSTNQDGATTATTVGGESPTLICRAEADTTARDRSGHRPVKATKKSTMPVTTGDYDDSFESPDQRDVPDSGISPVTASTPKNPS